MKKIKILIIVFIVIIILLTCFLLFIKKHKFEFMNIKNEVQYETQIVNNQEEYFSIHNAVLEYCSYISDGKYEDAYSLLDKEYVESYNITIQDLKNKNNEKYTNFISEKICSYDFDEYSKIYFVKGLLYKVTKERVNNTDEDDIYELNELEQRKYKNDEYYIVKVDLENSTFAISQDFNKYHKILESM